MEDPFKNVKNLSVEISQSTYTELISVTLAEDKAVSSRTNVNNAAPELAYNKRSKDTQSGGSGSNIIVGNMYDYSSQMAGARSETPSKATKPKNRTNKTALDFNNIVKNASPPIGGEIICGIDNNISCGIEASRCPIDIAFVIDDTSSMSQTLVNVLSSLELIASYFTEISNDYRMALATFKDCYEGDQVGRVQFGCNNIDAVIAALRNVRAGGGSDSPEASDIAISRAMSGISCGQWRGNGVEKIIILITDAPPGGCAESFQFEDFTGKITTDPAIDQFLRALATAANDCGIKFVIPFITSSFNPFPIFEEIATTTNGYYTTTKTGSDLPNLLASYIFSLCGRNTVVENPECGASKNKILNGGFDIGIEGWEEAAPTISWNEAERAMYIVGTDIIRGSTYQRIVGLTAGTRVSLGFNVKGLQGYTIYYGILAGDNSVNEEYQLSENLIYNRLNAYAVVPSSGEIIIYFETNDKVFVDDVFVCEVPSATCGAGSANAVKNSDFVEGVEFWSNDDGILTPFDDPQYWDSDNQAAILSIDGTLQIKQTVDIAKNSTLKFFILNNEPFDIKELGVRVKVTLGSETYLDEVVTNKDITEFPYEFSKLINGPDLAGATLEIFSGPGSTSDGFSGFTLIRGISICKSDPLSCPSETLDRTAFDAGRNGWAGGELDTEQGMLRLLKGEICSKTFTDLTPGTEVTLTYVASSPWSFGTVYELTSGAVTNKGNFTGSAKIFIQSDGVLNVRIYDNGTSADLEYFYLDDILLCQVKPVDCTGSVKGMRVMFEWQTMPKNPVNIMTGFLKYNIRDYTNPDITSTKYVVPLEGHLSIEGPTSDPNGLGLCNTTDTCDLWKQQGSLASGTLTAVEEIFKTNLSLYTKNSGSNWEPVLKNIEAGQTQDLRPAVNPTTNWVWAIPSHKDRIKHDRCVMIANLFVNGDIEKNVQDVTIYFLMNQIVPAEAVDYYCGPLEDYNCYTETDAFDIIISYVNSKGVLKEFRQRVNREDIYAEEEAFIGPPNDWDAPKSVGYGRSGSVARWEKVTFVLDNTLGTGLDQCSKPIAPKTFTGSGDIVYSEYKFNSNAQFIDPCDAEVLIEAVAEGSGINEIQSIVLPNPTGGTWTLSVTIRGVTKTATISGTAKASQVQSALEALSNVGAGNIEVTGQGTATNPFLVEFVGDLGGTNWPLMTANGNNLLGSATGLVTTVADGGRNERQKIIPSDKNMVSLVVSFNGSTSAPIPYDATLDVKQSLIEAIPTVGVGNVLVTGETTSRITPYVGPLIIDFIGALANTNVPQMEASPSPNWTAITLYNGGGNNEIQNITVEAKGGTYKLKVFDPTVNGSGLLRLTIPPNNSPTLAAYKKTSNEPLNDNKSGTEIPGRPGFYEFDITSWPDGDFVVDIINPPGRFCLRKVNGRYYTGTTWVEVEEYYNNGSDSSGNNGVDVPSALNEYFITDSIPYNATAAQVKSALSAAPFLGLSVLSVTKLDASGDTHRWQVEFIGALASTNLLQMQIDTSALLGGKIVITSTSNGESTPESQRIKIIRADAGYFNLVITVDGVTETTDNITWNTTADGLRGDIASHSKIRIGQVNVVQETPADPEIVGQFLVTISRLGNIALFEALYQESLLCNPNILEPVPEPPYEYPLTCETVLDSCAPGPLPSRPCDGDTPLALEPCCDPIRDSANVALYYKYARELFDPNTKSVDGNRRTIKEIARSRNINITKYNAYLRDFGSNTLEPVSYNTVIETGMSIILIDAQIDTSGGRYQVQKHLATTREVLPMRMNWPKKRLPLVN